jgi:hypothetical protein
MPRKPCSDTHKSMTASHYVSITQFSLGPDHTHTSYSERLMCSRCEIVAKSSLNIIINRE